MIPTSTGAGEPGRSTGNSSTANRAGRANVRGQDGRPERRRSDVDLDPVKPGRVRSRAAGVRQVAAEERHARRLAPLDDVRPRELEARARVDVEPVDVLGAAGVGEVEQADRVLAVGGHAEVDQGVEARVAPARRQATASFVLELEDRAELRVEPLRPAFDHHALARPGVESVGVDVARRIDPPAEPTRRDRPSGPPVLSPFGSVSRRVVRGLTKKPCGELRPFAPRARRSYRPGGTSAGMLIVNCVSPRFDALMRGSSQ